MSSINNAVCIRFKNLDYQVITLFLFLTSLRGSPIFQLDARTGFFQLGNCSDGACSCHLSQTQCLGSLPMSGEDPDLVPERPQAGDWMSRVPSPRLWCHRSPGILGGFGNRNKFLQETLTEYFLDTTLLLAFIRSQALSTEGGAGWV